MLQNVIKERPDAHDAWLTLGMIYNSQKNITKMVQCRLMAAHLNPANGELWRPLGFTSKELDIPRQAVYCFRKAISFDPMDVESMWELAGLYSDMNNLDLVMETLKMIVEVTPFDIKAVKEIARLYLRDGNAANAIVLFETLFEEDSRNPLRAEIGIEEDDDDFDTYDHQEIVLADTSLGRKVEKQRMGFEELNMLAELYIEVRDYEKAITNIKTGIYRLLGKDAVSLVLEDDKDLYVPNNEIPLELLVKLGICRLCLNDIQGASPHFEKLFNSDPENYSDQFLEVAETYMKRNQHMNAIQVLNRKACVMVFFG
jgi:tetratricopeptide (TPR) repeat protein